jgi:hypothetical protein
MEVKKSEVLSEYGRSKLKVEILEHNLIGLTSTFSGHVDTTVYLYQHELEKALEFVKNNN